MRHKKILAIDFGGGVLGFSSVGRVFRRKKERLSPWRLSMDWLHRNAVCIYSNKEYKFEQPFPISPRNPQSFTLKQLHPEASPFPLTPGPNNTDLQLRTISLDIYLSYLFKFLA